MSRELSWEANGLHIAGLGWGESGGRPVLALHGWLDNAASFAMLGPGLSGCEVVAIDLTGHGRSDHRSLDATYQIWDDLPQIVAVIDQLGWQEFDLVGHSRGAVIACLLAAAVPERVKNLVMLDAIGPAPSEAGIAPEQLRRFIEDRARLIGREPRVFDTEDEAIALREQRNNMSRQSAEPIARRNLRGAPDGFGYSWTTDSRLQGASAAKFTLAQVEAVWRRLTMPALLLLAESGDYVEKQRQWARQAQAHFGRLLVEQLPGRHHFHMEESADAIASRILKFLQESGE